MSVVNLKIIRNIKVLYTLSETIGPSTSVLYIMICKSPPVSNMKLLHNTS